MHNRKSDMSLICSFEYERDPVGNPTSIVWGNGALTYYDYDAGHQLTGERQFNTQGEEIHSYEWEYDAAGNRTGRNGVRPLHGRRRRQRQAAR